MKSHKAFSIVELLVVVVTIVFLLGIMMPSFSKPRRDARQALCESNLKQLGRVLNFYANDHDGNLILSSYDTYLWDIDYEVADTFINYGAVRDLFFCPSNVNKNPDNDLLWYYSDNGSSNNYIDGGRGYRSTSYCFLMDLSEDFVGRSTPASFDTNRDYVYNKNTRAFPWPRNINEISRPSSTPLLIDIVIQSNGQQKFSKIQGNSFLNPKLKLYDNSNHLNLKGELPIGGNQYFADGHIEWIEFDTMSQMYQHKNDTLVYWW